MAADTSRGSDERATAVRELLYAVAATLILLLPSSTREIVSDEAFAVAVSGGAIAGIGVGLLLEGSQIGADRSDVAVTIASLASIVVATVLVWLLLPSEHLSTLMQFCLVFVWSLTLTSVVRNVVWPAVVGPPDARERAD